jgi:hypothetical protein
VHAGFSGAVRATVSAGGARAADAVELFVEEDVEAAMSRFNAPQDEGTR